VPESILPHPQLSGSALERQLASQRARRPADPLVSLIVPVFNEEESIDLYLDTVPPLMERDGFRFEIVFVNDGSHDNTLAHLLDRAVLDRRLRIVNLSRNFGKEAALTAGLEAARGDVVIAMDGDFQHPLEALPDMLARWREGYDMIYGVRSSRRDETWTKRAGAALFYGILSHGGDVQIQPGAGDFRLMDRKVVDALLRLPERSRFLKGLYGWVGFRTLPFVYDVQPRAAGRSSFALPRLIGLGVAGVTAFTYTPLRAIGAMGVLISALAILYGGYVVVETLVLGAKVPGYPTLVTSIMLFSGVQLLSLGVLGEYLARVYEEVKHRPTYLVGDEVDFSEVPASPRRER
jgi:polyisoprenyl-phosphate glycosyltransferase